MFTGLYLVCYIARIFLPFSCKLGILFIIILLSPISSREENFLSKRLLKNNALVILRLTQDLSCYAVIPSQPDTDKHIGELLLL